MQGELFQIGGGVTRETLRASGPPAGWMDQFRVTLRVDHLLIAGIFALVLYVLVFSFGVEKGKRYAVREREAEKARQEVSQPPEPAVASPALVTPPTPVQPETSAELAPEKPTVLNGQYTIQLITFTNRKQADQEVERLKSAGFQAFIIPSGRFFQVCAESFQTVSEAKEKLTHLRTQGMAQPDAYVRPFKGITSF